MSISEFFGHVRDNNADKLQYLLEQHPEYLCQPDSESGDYALHIASKKGLIRVLTVLLDAEVNTELRDNSEMTALIEAARSGHSNVVHALLVAGAEVDAQDMYGQTALQWACWNEHANIVGLLLAFGADINVTDKVPSLSADIFTMRQKRLSPLMAAAHRTTESIITMLINAGASIDAVDENNFTALMCASLYNHPHIVKIFLNAGASIHVQSTDGSSALLWATSKGHTDVVGVLLDNGANVEDENKKSAKSLGLAADNGFNDIVDVLLAHNAHVNCRNSQMMTPLYKAATKGHVAIVKKLLAAGADVHALSDVKKTALTTACECGHADVALLLLEAGSDVNAQTKWGGPPLSFACEYHRVEVVRVLLGWAGIQINLPNNRGDTPIIFAASEGHADILSLLLQHGADVNHTNIDNATALMWASWNGHCEAVKVLLSAGADIHIMDKDKHTALSKVADDATRNVLLMHMQQIRGRMRVRVSLPHHFEHDPPVLNERHPSFNITVELDAKSTLQSQLEHILKALQSHDMTEDTVYASTLEKYESGFFVSSPISPTAILKQVLKGTAGGRIPHLLLWCDQQRNEFTVLSVPPKKLHVSYHPYLQAEPTEALLHVPSSTPISDICRIACRAVNALRCNVSICCGAEKRMISNLGKIFDAALLNQTWADINGNNVVISDAIANTIPHADIKMEPAFISDTGHSVVYRGTFHTLDVAVKVLRGNAVKSSRDLQAELAVLSKLRHPKILTMVGIVEDVMAIDGSVAIVSEYMARGSLYDVLHSKASDPLMSDTSKLRVLQDIADGMRFLHANNVIHRDLKSPNVLIDGDGRAKLCDFGSSAVLQDSQTHATGIIGTAAWSAPEALDSLDVRFGTDSYSFGVIVWEVGTGRIPWDGLSVLQICTKKSNGENLPLQPLRSAHATWEPLVTACFSSNPDQRPSFTMLYEDLTAMLMHERETTSVSSSFLCPIGLELMHDPVTCCDGHTYERENIEKWLEVSILSPCTGLPLQNLELIPAHTLRNIIEEYTLSQK